MLWKSTAYEQDPGQAPTVTLVVTAYNEEKILKDKILNTFQLDHPKQNFNIIFNTDGSTDGSNDIIKQYPSINLLYEPQRKGKLAAMNRSIRHAAAGIVIFSDANTLLNKDCINNILPHFNNPRVGGVAGEKKIFAGDGVAGGEGAYWKYESFLKKLDSRLYSVVGAAGELFAIRKSLYTPLDEQVILDDFVQSLLLCKKGYVVRYEPAAYASEKASFSLADEKERKIRISAGGFQAMIRLKSLLNIFKYGLLSFQYISHRVLRWTLCPLSLILVFLAAIYLYIQLGSPLYGVIAGLQVLFYLAAIASLYSPSRLFYLPFYFCFMNYCVVAGFIRYLRGRQQATWQKAARQ